MANSEPSDVLIVGGGIAGLSLTLQLPGNARITLIAKAALDEGASLYAQSGIAAVLDEVRDSLAAHIEDTLRAGAGLCHRQAVEHVIRHGPDATRWLIAQGVPFSHEDGPDGAARYHLTREGGHSHRRVFHAEDATGRAIVGALQNRVRSQSHITVLEECIAVDLISRAKLGQGGPDRCVGLYVLDKTAGTVRTLAARHMVLATGGAAKVYLYTSNPNTSTGDGIAMAWRAGCRVANMEFIQFHPTCLYHPLTKSFLISGAVRGEGGVLRRPNGERFMPRHDPRAELAPRDIVARAPSISR